MDVGQVRRDVQGSCVMKSVFEQIGKTPAEIEAKLQTAFGQLFEGDPENERVCFNHGDDLAYIVDIGHTDIRSEGMSYGMTIAALMGSATCSTDSGISPGATCATRKAPWKVIIPGRFPPRIFP